MSASTGIDITGSGGSGGATGSGGSCADAVVKADVTVKPVDVIFMIDVSGSMSEEINGIEKNINQNFAQIIGKSGIDYRIILLADHGPGQFEVCIEEPLSTIPQGGCATISPSTPPGNKKGKFYHYSLANKMQSTDSICHMLNSLVGNLKDDFSLAPLGWIDWLRPEAYKAFVIITDDRMSCTWTGVNPAYSFSEGFANSPAQAKSAAFDVDQALTVGWPKLFGTAQKRNYAFYSLVGIANKNVAHDIDMPSNFIAPNAKPLDAFLPTDAATKDKCSTAVNSGLAYQYLSKDTGGLRFPLCELNGYDVIFNAIASGVVAGATVPCEFPVPKPKDPNKKLDYKTVSVLYTPTKGSVQTFSQIADANACGAAKDKFYIDTMKDMIYLCPEACKLVKTDAMAKVEVKIECGGDAF
jgi:hypothetical protein